MRVLGFLRDSDDKMDAVHYYRTYLPLREVHRHDNDIEAQCAGRTELAGATDDELGGRDIYSMCRMYNDQYEPFIKQVHKEGGLFVFDSDDDRTETYKMVSGRGDEFKEVLGVADYVTCSTPTVAKLFGQYTQRPPTVLGNRIDVDWMQETAARGRRLVEGLTLGFSGSPTHWGDWYIPAVPFSRIGIDYPDVTLVLHGETPRYLSYAEEKASVLKLGGVPFSNYPILLNQFDILLCSVNCADEFNSGKSNVKALEAMALGVVPICSRFKPYLELKEAGAPIIVVDEDTRDGWYEAMKWLIEHDQERRRRSILGPIWVKEHMDMNTGGYKQWQDFYNEIAN